MTVFTAFTLTRKYGRTWLAAQANRPYKMANQGGMVMVLKISLFADPAQFKQEMDHYVRGVRKMRPLEGLDQSFLPGGIEVEYEQAYRQAGIPIGTEHREVLEDVGKKLEIAVPWA